MSDIVTPTNDGVFKLLFAAEDNRPGLIGLLTAVLQPPQPITDAKVLNPEIPKENITDKGTTLDILVELADGSRINVEMQMVPGITLSSEPTIMLREPTYPCSNEVTNINV